MHKHIRPANEEFTGAIYGIFFSIIWYGEFFKILITYGFQLSHILAIVGGLIPVIVSIDTIRRALFYRKKRQEAIVYNDRCTGIITKIVQQYQRDPDAHNHQKYRKFYYLYVDMYINDGTIYTIKSEAYRKPIFKYLSSNKVSVYTDESGWHYYLEDFVYKEHKDDPDAFSFPQEYHSIFEYIQKIIIVLIYLFFIYQLIFIPV